MLNKMLELGMIKKVDCGYVQAYDEDGRIWSKKRASMTLSIEFGYRPTAHHVSLSFMKKFNRLSEEHLIRWERMEHDSRALPPRQNKRRECELDLGFDPERCPECQRSNIQKRYLRILKIEDREKRKQFIDRYREFLKRHHPEIYPELNQVDAGRKIESLESILATSGALFNRFSNCDCDYDDKYGQSYDERFN